MSIWDECIEWDGTLDSHFYGKISIRSRSKSPLRVHRLVWEEERGPIPPGMCVCHKCDNPPCINIDHLFLGTQKDNMLDKVAKGRDQGQKKTHCPRGHALAPPNLVAWKLKQGHRECLTCAKEHWRRHTKKRRADARATREAAH